MISKKRLAQHAADATQAALILHLLDALRFIDYRALPTYASQLIEYIDENELFLLELFAFTSTG